MKLYDVPRNSYIKLVPTDGSTLPYFVQKNLFTNVYSSLYAMNRDNPDDYSCFYVLNDEEDEKVILTNRNIFTATQTPTTSGEQTMKETKISNDIPVDTTTVNILSIIRNYVNSCEDAYVVFYNDKYSINLGSQVFYAYTNEKLVEIINALTVLYKS